MSKYILLYKGPATPMDKITEEQGAEIMQQWGIWIGKVGSALVDVGNPFGQSSVVNDGGKSAQASDLNGFSIVEAENIQAAEALTDGHPFLNEGSGKFNVEIFELVPM